MANGTCTFVFQPSFFQGGERFGGARGYHPLEQHGADAPDVLKFTIPTRRRPHLAGQERHVGAENVQLFLVVTADDPDGTTPLITAQNVPVGATFDIRSRATARHGRISGARPTVSRGLSDPFPGLWTASAWIR